MQVTKDRQQKRLTTKEEQVSTNQTDTRTQVQVKYTEEAGPGNRREIHEMEQNRPAAKKDGEKDRLKYTRAGEQMKHRGTLVEKRRQTGSGQSTNWAVCWDKHMHDYRRWSKGSYFSTDEDFLNVRINRRPPKK